MNPKPGNRQRSQVNSRACGKVLPPICGESLEAREGMPRVLSGGNVSSRETGRAEEQDYDGIAGAQNNFDMGAAQWICSTASEPFGTKTQGTSSHSGTLFGYDGRPGHDVRLVLVRYRPEPFRTKRKRTFPPHSTQTRCARDRVTRAGISSESEREVREPLRRTFRGSDKPQSIVFLYLKHIPNSDT